MKKICLIIAIAFLFIKAMGQDAPPPTVSAGSDYSLDGFEANLKTIVVSATSKFASIKGAEFPKEKGSWGTKYETNINLIKEANCYIQSFMGESYTASLTYEENAAVAEAQYSVLYSRITKTLGKSYYCREGIIDETYHEVKKAFWGENFSGGFSEYRVNLQMSNRDGKYTVVVFVSSGERNKYYTAKTGRPSDPEFAKAIKEIQEASFNKFEAVLGTKHESNGLFGKSVSYDITPSVSGFTCTYVVGGLSLNDVCECKQSGFSTEEEAKKIYDEIYKKISTGLGSGWAYKELTPSKYTVTGSRFGKIEGYGIDNKHAIELSVSTVSEGKYEVVLAIGKFIF